MQTTMYGKHTHTHIKKKKIKKRNFIQLREFAISHPKKIHIIKKKTKIKRHTNKEQTIQQLQQHMGKSIQNLKKS